MHRIAAPVALAPILLLVHTAGAASVDLGGGDWQVTPGGSTPIVATGGSSVSIEPGAVLSGVGDDAALTVTTGGYTVTQQGTISPDDEGIAILIAGHGPVTLDLADGSYTLGDIRHVATGYTIPNAITLAGSGILDGDLNLDNSHAVTLTHAGPGTVVVRGDGRTHGPLSIVEGGLDFHEKLTVNAGDVTLASDTTLRVRDTFAGSGNLIIPTGAYARFDGRVGPAVHLNGGRVDLNADDSYDLHLAGGVLGASSPESSLPSTVTNITGSITVADDLVLDGNLQFQGDIDLNGGTPTLSLRQDAAIAGTISNGNLRIEAGLHPRDRHLHQQLRR